MDAERATGHSPYFFPVGASVPLGCWGYIRGMAELAEQLGRDEPIDLFCATLVIGTFFGLSYCYGEAIFQRIRQVEFSVTTIAVLVLVAVGIYFWRRHVRRAAKESATKPEETADDEGNPAELGDEVTDDKEDGEVDWLDASSRSSGLAQDSRRTDALSASGTTRRVH